ncbi:hypothetical protein MFMK1_002928 [Metallumcola ferriviriculae]|uniref:Uncharacterized protein n=1 Tax=Metallumcola ferriviriculae TaxID=3039180 RepID=A0AAU0UPR0_9FIRM|nr:hypothetical protein MFMK1_002928 [Desulfitibacteraceae bacterium MK1]
MKKSILFILTICTILTVSSCYTPLEQKSFVINKFEVNTHNFNAAQPDISNGNLVWAGGNNRVSSSIYLLDKVFLYDLDTKQITTLFHTQFNGQTDETQINSKWVCWTDWNGEKGAVWKIYAYSLERKKLYKIASGQSDLKPDQNTLPRLTLSSNDYLAWFQTSNADEILQRSLKLYNIETREERDIALVKSPKAMPNISRKYLVWSEDKTIFVYSLSKEKVIEKIITDQLAMFPKVNDEYVIWNEVGVYPLLKMKRIGEKKKTDIFTGSVFFFDIGTDYIVWQSKPNGSIFAYSISRNSTETITSSGLLPYIRGNNLIWETKGKDNKVIFHVAKLF